MTRSPFSIWVIFILPVVMLGLSACVSMKVTNIGLTPAPAKPAMALAPLPAMPEFVRKAAPPVQEAYRFAAANPEVLRQFPCYCGCGTMGHRDNLDCYVKQFRPDGSIEFDNHAAGCTICVDITHDVMRFRQQGQDLKTIRAYVDAHYSQFAAPTNTAPIP